MGPPNRPLSGADRGMTTYLRRVLHCPAPYCVCLSSQSNTVACHCTEFCGLRTQ